MQYFYLLEWAATFVESLVLLCATVSISGRRPEKSWRNFMTVLSAVGLTVLTAFLNSVSAFSFLTPVITMCITVLIPARILSDGSLLTRCMAGIMAYFVILTVDYIIFTLFGVLAGWSENTFSIIITAGTPRAVFLVIDKSMDVLLYVLTRRFLPGIGTLKKKYQVSLFFIFLAAYMTTQYLFSAVLSADRDALYRILIFSWIYLLFFVAIVIVAFILTAKSEQEKQTRILLKSTNQLLTENYQRLYAYQQNRAKQLHDFNRHLTALKGLASQSKHKEISAYIDSLLSVTYQETALCHSGSDIIDAIINQKAAEAEHLQITFRFTANLPVPVHIDPVDICGALANQIDNAFDACKQMPLSEHREVKVAVKQVGNFVFFRVENTVSCNPFENNQSLSSTKTDMSAQHGLGLKNIRDIADKYSGVLRSEYKDGVFISVVSLCCELLDTEKSDI